MKLDSPIRSLFDLSLQVVFGDITNTVDYHLRESGCRICVLRTNVPNCSEMKVLKDYLQVTPNILQALYKIIMMREPVNYLNPNHLNHVYCYLLECNELLIPFQIVHLNDLEFLTKYGKCVRELYLYCEPLFAGKYLDLWKDALVRMSNLEVVHFNWMLNDFILELIGKYCHKIKRLEDIDYLKANSISADSFKKLGFFDGTDVKNPCANTLEYINVEYFEFVTTLDNKKEQLNEIVSVLAQNFPYLKCLGEYFSTDVYLRSVNQEDIKQSSLENVFISTAEHEQLPLMKVFCPKMKTLHVKDHLIDNFQKLHDFFPHVEGIKSCGFELDDGTFYKSFFSSTWSNLKVLEISNFKNQSIDLSVIAKQLPVIEILHIGCKEIKCCNSATNFKFLKNFKVMVNQIENILWVKTFAKTVKRLEIYAEGTYDLGNENVNLDKYNCNVLVCTLLPELEILVLSPLVFDYSFITTIISVCSSLKKFRLYNLTEKEYLSIERFMLDNKYICNTGI